jgi:hypothetical protein
VDGAAGDLVESAAVGRISELSCHGEGAKGKSAASSRDSESSGASL